MHVLKRLVELAEQGETIVLATVVRVTGSVPRHTGSRMLIFRDGSIEGTIGGGEMEGRVIGEAMDSFQDGKGRLITYSFRNPDEGGVGVCGGDMDVFIEPVSPEPTLVVVGGGHVGKAVVSLASWLGYRVVASDDRAEFAREEAAPGADMYLHCEMKDLPERMTIHSNCFLLLTTRGTDVDIEGLPALLKTPAAFIGVIGSRRRWETTAQSLLEQGCTEEDIKRITSPMGLELKAESPEEIAVSILAEIIMLRQGGSGERMAHERTQRRRRKGV